MASKLCMSGLQRGSSRSLHAIATRPQQQPPSLPHFLLLPQMHHRNALHHHHQHQHQHQPQQPSHNIRAQKRYFSPVLVFPPLPDSMYSLNVLEDEKAPPRELQDRIEGPEEETESLQSTTFESRVAFCFSMLQRTHLENVSNVLSQILEMTPYFKVLPPNTPLPPPTTLFKSYNITMSYDPAIVATHSARAFALWVKVLVCTGRAEEARRVATAISECQATVDPTFILSFTETLTRLFEPIIALKTIDTVVAGFKARRANEPNLDATLVKLYFQKGILLNKIGNFESASTAFENCENFAMNAAPNSGPASTELEHLSFMTSLYLAWSKAENETGRLSGAEKLLESYQQQVGLLMRHPEFPKSPSKDMSKGMIPTALQHMSTSALLATIKGELNKERDAYSMFESALEYGLTKQRVLQQNIKERAETARAHKANRGAQNHQQQRNVLSGEGEEEGDDGFQQEDVPAIGGGDFQQNMAQLQLNTHRTHIQNILFEWSRTAYKFGNLGEIEKVMELSHDIGADDQAPTPESFESMMGADAHFSSDWRYLLMTAFAADLRGLPAEAWEIVQHQWEHMMVSLVTSAVPGSTLDEQLTNSAESDSRCASVLVHAATQLIRKHHDTVFKNDEIVKAQAIKIYEDVFRFGFYEHKGVLYSLSGMLRNSYTRGFDSWDGNLDSTSLNTQFKVDTTITRTDLKTQEQTVRMRQMIVAASSEEEAVGLATDFERAVLKYRGSKAYEFHRDFMVVQQAPQTDHLGYEYVDGDDMVNDELEHLRFDVQATIRNPFKTKQAPVRPLPQTEVATVVRGPTAQTRHLQRGVLQISKILPPQFLTPFAQK